MSLREDQWKRTDFDRFRHYLKTLIAAESGICGDFSLFSVTLLHCHLNSNKRPFITDGKNWMLSFSKRSPWLLFLLHLCLREQRRAEVPACSTTIKLGQSTNRWDPELSFLMAKAQLKERRELMFQTTGLSSCLKRQDRKESEADHREGQKAGRQRWGTGSEGWWRESPAVSQIAVMQWFLTTVGPQLAWRNC